LKINDPYPKTMYGFSDVKGEPLVAAVMEVGEQELLLSQQSEVWLLRDWPVLFLGNRRVKTRLKKYDIIHDLDNTEASELCRDNS